MGYKFSSKLLRGFNGIDDASVQLAAARDNFWNADTVVVFKKDPTLFTAFMADLNGLLDAAEQGKFGSEQFDKLAKVCVSMCGDAELLKSFYALDANAVGVFLMRCMRVNNLSTHSSSALKGFRKIFDAVGIKVAGNWDLCVEVASFEWTEFSNGTLTVAPPGG